MFSPGLAIKSIVPKVFVLLAFSLFLLYGTQSAQAQYSQSVAYTFTGGSDGADSSSNLISDSKGNLYGTAVNGGNTSGSNCPGLNPPTGCGVVFELTPPTGGSGPWTETVLYTFQGGSDGAYPQAGLVFDSKGNLYGTTSGGGDLTGSCTGLEGCGVVFELSPPPGGMGAWTETVLHTFTDGNKGGSDGNGPYGGLIFDSKGNLYGTTSGGGTSSAGTVFELSPPSGGTGPWTETQLYSFSDGPDGSSPLCTLVFDSLGNLYGTTYGGGTGYIGHGVVFELSPPSGGTGSWSEVTLYTFTGKADGGSPFAGLVFDSNGNLFGTSVIGGQQNGSCKRTSGCGVVFELTPPGGGSGWSEAPIYTFTGATDGGYPYAGVILDSKGNVYGTTAQGGDISGANCSATDGCGLVFEIIPPSGGSGSWTESALYTFHSDTGGGFPYGAPMFDSAGNLFGTTAFGGDSSGSNCNPEGGCGVVYELTQQAGPVVTLSPTSLNFGNQVVGKTSKAKAVTVTNTGSLTLNITSITVSASFAISSNTCGQTLAVGAFCKVKVTFTPPQLGPVAGTLTFTDDAGNSPQNVPLSGTGVAVVTLTPASAKYARQKVGTTSKPKTFTLTNYQTVTLSGIAISTTGDFAVSATTCGATLAAGQKCTISVTFTPTQTGTRTGQLTVSDSAPNSPQTSSLTGTGV